MDEGKLTNGELSRELKSLIEKAEGELPQEITNQILTIMIQDTNRNFSRFRQEINDSLEKNTETIISKFKLMEESNKKTNDKITEMEKEQTKYPSLTKWVDTHRRQTFIIALGFFVTSQVWFISGFRYIVLSSVLHIAGKLFGLPDETIDQILSLLFA